MTPSDLYAYVGIVALFIALVAYVMRKPDRKEVEAVCKEHEKQITHLERDLSGLSARVESTEGHIEEKFRGLEAWLQRIEAKIDRLSNGFRGGD